MNLSFLKKAGKVALSVGEVAAPAAATAFLGPAVGSMVTTAIHSIVEQSHNKDASGPEKKAAVMQTLETVAPQVDALLTSMGKTVNNQDKFADGADKLVEALLDMLKATGTVDASDPTKEVPEKKAEPSDAEMLQGIEGFVPQGSSVVLTKGFDKPVVVYIRQAE